MPHKGDRAEMIDDTDDPSLGAVGAGSNAGPHFAFVVICPPSR
jgi:hypothetical protein